MVTTVAIELFATHTVHVEPTRNMMSQFQVGAAQQKEKNRSPLAVVSDPRFLRRSDVVLNIVSFVAVVARLYKSVGMSVCSPTRHFSFIQIQISTFRDTHRLAAAYH